MEDSSREWRVRWAVLVQAMLAGGAIAVLALAGNELFLLDVEELLSASTALLVTLVAALAVGLWAGVPAARSEEPPLRTRWFAAGVTMGVAGGFTALWGMYGELLGGVLGRSLALLLLVGAPAYVLGLLFPALLAWADQREETEDVWEPLGTIVLGILAGLAVGFLLGGLLLIPRFAPGTLLLGTAAALILPTLLPEAESQHAEERVIYEAESSLNTIRIVEIIYPGRRQPERRLYVNDEEESGELIRSGAPTLPYIAAAEQWLAEVSAPGDSYLFLGGGAYTLPRRVIERDSKAQVTVVELDPEITRVAYRFFGLRREHRIRTVHGDARAFVDRNAADVEGTGEYDQIYMDVYSGSEALPYPLVTREAFSTLGRLLRPGGLLVLNLIGVTADRESRRLWSVVRTVADVFPSLALYVHLGRDFPERQNVLLAASLEPARDFPARAGFFEPWPRDEWPGWEGTMVYQDLYPNESGKEAAARANPGPSAGLR